MDKSAGAVRFGFSIKYNGSLDREGGTEIASFFSEKNFPEKITERAVA